MKKYIDTEKLLLDMAEVYDKLNPDLCGGQREGILIVKKIIEKQEAAPVVEKRSPRVQGRWEIAPTISMSKIYRCSLCKGESPTGAKALLPTSCPHCGANMII